MVLHISNEEKKIIDNKDVLRYRKETMKKRNY